LSLWGEVKQRRITQIVFAYLAGGYVALTVVDQVVDREIFPGVVYRVALTLYLFGIAYAVILGWYHGQKGDQKASFPEIVMLGVVSAAMHRVDDPNRARTSRRCRGCERPRDLDDGSAATRGAVLR
jgi:hypothetical protein